LIPYVNIHTHHLSKDDGVFLFNNRFGFDKELYTKSYFSLGIHPWDSDIDVSVFEFEKLIQNKNCIAIGECGLDKLNGPDLEIQKRVLKFQLNLAAKYQKPVIIHCVKAFDEIIEICEPFQTKIPLIIHGFNKSQQLALDFIEKGFYLSFGSSVFKKNEFDFKSIPLNKLFLETDTNDTFLIKDIYKMAAQQFKISEDYLKEKIYSKFTTLFKKNGR
jgi:TatD DNase family protein